MAGGVVPLPKLRAGLVIPAQQGIDLSLERIALCGYREIPLTVAEPNKRLLRTRFGDPDQVGVAVVVNICCEQLAPISGARVKVHMAAARVAEADLDDLSEAAREKLRFVRLVVSVKISVEGKRVGQQCRP